MARVLCNDDRTCRGRRNAMRIAEARERRRATVAAVPPHAIACDGGNAARERDHADAVGGVPAYDDFTRRGQFHIGRGVEVYERRKAAVAVGR